MQIDPRLPKLS